MTEKSDGVTTSGLKYPLNNATMFYGSTLGTSNEVLGDSATVSVADGRLLVITSMEGQK
jgi:thiamine pyrophosphokinase